jgi:hypothetical protein
VVSARSAKDLGDWFELIGSVRLEAMITIARYGRTTRPRPQRAIAMTVLFVVTIPTA